MAGGPGASYRYGLGGFPPSPYGYDAGYGFNAGFGMPYGGGGFGGGGGGFGYGELSLTVLEIVCRISS